MTARVSAELVLLGVTFAWGGSFLVVKDTLGSLPPFTLLALRFALASVALAAVFRGRALALGPRGERTPRRWPRALWIGALLWAGFALQTAGLVYTTPARSGFITASYVAMVPLLSRARLKRALRARVLAAVAAALVGLLLLSDPRGGGVNLGDGLTLLCALAFAAHMIALERWGRAMPSGALAFAQMAAVGSLSLPFAVALETPPRELSGSSLAALAYLGLICSAGAFLGQTWGQRHTSSTRAGLIFSLESLFAALLSVALGAEALTPSQWLGGLSLVGGVVLGELPERDPPPGSAARRK